MSGVTSLHVLKQNNFQSEVTLAVMQGFHFCKSEPPGKLDVCEHNFVELLSTS